MKEEENKSQEASAEQAQQPPQAPQEGAEQAPQVPGELQDDVIDEITAKRKKQMAILAVSIFVIIGLIGAGGLFYYKKKFANETVESDPTKIAGPQKQMLFRQMDEIIVNLNTENRSTSFMKLKITLEVEGKNNLNAINNMMPRIRDIFQTYLRELRPQDLQGSMGLYTLREELLLRINKVVYPAQVNDILFDEVLIQ